MKFVSKNMAFWGDSVDRGPYRVLVCYSEMRLTRVWRVMLLFFFKKLFDLVN